MIRKYYFLRFYEIFINAVYSNELSLKTNYKYDDSWYTIGKPV